MSSRALVLTIAAALGPFTASAFESSLRCASAPARPAGSACGRLPVPRFPA
jgi:hypothetical protein